MAINLRPSPIAGLWYSDEPKNLAASIDTYLDEATPLALDGKVIAVVSPHAGHIYCGRVAGAAFASVKGNSYDVVVVLSPMHHPYRQPLLVTGHDAYSTPLGSISVDKNLVEEIDSIIKPELGFGITPVLNDPEHSLEIVLPFLQRAIVGDFSLLPIMIHLQTPKVSEVLGKAIGLLMEKRNCLLVASSDLSHFYPDSTACELDSEMMKAIESFTPHELFILEQEEKGFACGVGAVAAVLWAARQLGADKVKILQHATSGPATGDFTRVVGYGAAAVIKTI